MTLPKQFWITIQQPTSKLLLLWNSKTLETKFNAAANEQKAITAMYTKATVEGKPIRLILDSELAGKKAPVFEFEEEKEMPLTEIYMALGSTSNWAEKTEQKIFEESREWKKVRYFTSEPRKEPPYIPLKYKDCKKKLSSMEALENKTTHLVSHVEICYWKNATGLMLQQEEERGTPFDVAYNSVLNKLYHYSYDAKIIFDLAMALINKAIQKDIHQMKEAEYIEYTMKLTEFNYEDESAIQLKYFNNNGQEIKPEKTHEVDAGYDLRYSGKDTLSLIKINLKIALEIPLRAMVQIAFRSSLASKRINIRKRVLDAGYTGDITIMLQNKTDKPFRIEHTEKITQAIYLPLINISGLQSVKNRKQLEKSERKTQGFGSTGRFIVPVNIALNAQNKSHQILQLPQPITISPFGEHHEIYICSKLTTTQQIFESNEQIYENPQIVSNFIEIIRHILLPNPNIISTTENYHLLEEKLSQINISLLEPQQQKQLKQLIAKFADIFTKDNNNLGKTDIVQHQIHTEDALPKRQQAY
ncbi:hypothetical protein G9A89_001175 [Geosiphon pyriformis]|nr:hypothetical protein G9A89_001175 [Geosiphon pyriformis]